MKNKIYLVVFCFLVTGCVQITTQTNEVSAPETPTIQPSMETLPNPASVFCKQQGYKLDIRPAEDGSQTGFCIFTDDSECDEWAYFRGECQPSTGGFSENENQDWKIYTNETLGYSFHYPVDAQVIINDEPLKSLFISGPGMGSETWGIAHPSDRVDYRPPVGADLLQWLTDHNLLGENRQSDEQIAGTTAVHFRHEASLQSYAFDQYYFANASQLYLITIGHSSNSEDWGLNNNFLQSFMFTKPSSNITLPTVIPTALPINPALYQDWTTYTHPDHSFSIKFPDGWIVEEVNKNDPLLVGHALNLSSVISAQPAYIRVTFRMVGEDTPLWPTGVGQGEFIPQGTLDIAGQPALRLLLVCPTGEVTEIRYHQSETQPNITRGNLEFGLILHTVGHCEPGVSLQGEIQLVGEMIIASLIVP
jgi:putative hemolysin